jgi:hypothetical protein
MPLDFAFSALRASSELFRERLFVSAGGSYSFGQPIGIAAQSAAADFAVRRSKKLRAFDALQDIGVFHLLL